MRLGSKQIQGGREYVTPPLWVIFNPRAMSLHVAVAEEPYQGQKAVPVVEAVAEEPSREHKAVPVVAVVGSAVRLQYLILHR